MARRKTHGTTSPKGSSRGSARAWIFGIHAALAAIRNPERMCHRLVIADDARAGLRQMLAAAEEARRAENRAGMPATEALPRKHIGRLLPEGAVHQGLAVLADPLVELSVDDLCDDLATIEDAVVVVLDQATDPRNVGAVLRAAAAFGARAVIQQTRHAPDAGGVLAKAASGALEQVHLVRVTNISRALDGLKASGFWCIGLDAEAPDAIDGGTLPARMALVLGAEGSGLRRLVGETCDTLVRIPTTGAVESLNLATAAAVALYEIRRGREA